MLVVGELLHSFPQANGPVLDIGRLEVSRQQMTVITGPSGSGKTTLLYVLSGLLRPQAGSVSWNGVDIVSLGEGARDRWRRSQAGFVFQNFNLIEEMVALDNVTIAANFAAFSAAGVRRRGHELLEQFGVPVEPRPVSTYSRGEQQRVAMARALLFDPPILFADEPTASLDATNAAVMTGYFKDLAAAGKAVIAVSHDPVVIEAADRVVTLEHGRLVLPEEVA